MNRFGSLPEHTSHESPACMADYYDVGTQNAAYKGHVSLVAQCTKILTDIKQFCWKKLQPGASAL